MLTPTSTSPTSTAPAQPVAGGAPSRQSHGPRRAAARGRSIDHEAFLAHVFTEMVDAHTSPARFAARDPRRLVRALRALAALPGLHVALPAAGEAPAVRGLLLRHSASRRAMFGVAAVLTVPPIPGDYAQGHDRATVRRKIRCAEKRGITVRQVPIEERDALLELANRHERENERAEYRIERPENDDLLDSSLWLAAYDDAGSPIALSVTPCAGEWGVLRYFRTLAPGPASSDARYLMARELAEELCEQGVRHLVDPSRPHWLPNGLRHFQRMIGFRLVRLRSIRIAKN